ncbi:phosphopantetheine-binding protein [Pseudomonadales bacterium]|nr:phosphopantetheine-binding protein [Pseudomonadales bacterium]
MKTMSIEGFDKLVSQLILGNLVDEANLIAPDTLLSELNMGAIEKVSLVVDLEKCCAVDIPDADIDDFRSVGDVVEYLEQHVAQNEKSR